MCGDQCLVIVVKAVSLLDTSIEDTNVKWTCGIQHTAVYLYFEKAVGWRLAPCTAHELLHSIRDYICKGRSRYLIPCGGGTKNNYSVLWNFEMTRAHSPSTHSGLFVRRIWHFQSCNSQIDIAMVTISCVAISRVANAYVAIVWMECTVRNWIDNSRLCN